MERSRQRIAQVYSELERKLKSSAKKEEALEQTRRRNQDENIGEFEILLDPTSEKIRTAEVSKTEVTNK